MKIIEFYLVFHIPGMFSFAELRGPGSEGLGNPLCSCPMILLIVLWGFAPSTTQGMEGRALDVGKQEN